MFDTADYITGGQAGFDEQGGQAVSNASGRKHFVGGSGRNWKVSNGPGDPAFPFGVYGPDIEDQWSTPEFPLATIVRDPGTGEIELNDGVDVVGSGTPTGSLSGVAQQYPGVPGPGTFPAHTFNFESEAAGVFTYRCAADPTIILTHNPSAESAYISVEATADIIVTLDGPSVAGSPVGLYECLPTSYGAVTYNGGDRWDYNVIGSPGQIAATTYGEDTYNGGAPFNIDVEFEGNITGRFVTVGFSAGTGQSGIYDWAGWQEWVSADDPAWVITIDGLGAGEITDGTDVVATRASDPDALYDPTGAWVSTSYGATTYGLSESATSGLPSAGTVAAQLFTLSFSSGGIETWPGVTNSAQLITLDTTTGDALLRDGVDVIAERLGGSLTDIDGAYTATPYGEEFYNTGAPFTFTVSTTSAGSAFSGSVVSQQRNTIAGYVFVVLEINGSNEVTGIRPPAFGPNLPANTSTEVSFPLAYSDSGGMVEQIHTGAITWRS